ncbi:collagen alpha-1(II) chain-like [Pseudopipra pipra]|uniref:collagen alpha-1(II) chain-like n=1 Tax=Pseudopipra pipra TaxID=415032 RepID=UPI003138F8E2
MAPRGCLPRCRPRGSVRPRGRARRPPPPPPPPGSGTGVSLSSPAPPPRGRLRLGPPRRRGDGRPANGARPARGPERPARALALPRRPCGPAAGGGSEEPPPRKAPSRPPPFAFSLSAVARRAPTAPLAPRAPRGPPALAASEPPPRPLARARGGEGRGSDRGADGRGAAAAAGRRPPSDERREKEGRAARLPAAAPPGTLAARSRRAGAEERAAGSGQLGAAARPGGPARTAFGGAARPGSPLPAGTRAPAGRPRPALRRGTDRRRTGAEGRAGLRGSERAAADLRPPGRDARFSFATILPPEPKDLGFPGAARRVMGITPPDRQSASFMVGTTTAASRGLAFLSLARPRARHAAGRGSAGADPPPKPARPAGRRLGRAAPPDVLEETATRRGGRGPVPEAPSARAARSAAGGGAATRCALRRYLRAGGASPRAFFFPPFSLSPLSGSPSRLRPHRRPALLAAGTHGRHPDPGRHRHLACFYPRTPEKLAGPRGRHTARYGEEAPPRREGRHLACHGKPTGRGDRPARTPASAAPLGRPRRSAGPPGALSHASRKASSIVTRGTAPRPLSLSLPLRGGRHVPQAADAGGPHATLHGSLPARQEAGAAGRPAPDNPRFRPRRAHGRPPQSGTSSVRKRHRTCRGATGFRPPRGRRLPPERPGDGDGEKNKKPPRKKHARLSLAVLATAARGSGRGPRPSLPDSLSLPTGSRLGGGRPLPGRSRALTHFLFPGALGVLRLKAAGAKIKKTEKKGREGAPLRPQPGPRPTDLRGTQPSGSQAGGAGPTARAARPPWLSRRPKRREGRGAAASPANGHRASPGLPGDSVGFSVCRRGRRPQPGRPAPPPSARWAGPRLRAEEGGTNKRAEACRGRRLARPSGGPVTEPLRQPAGPRRGRTPTASPRHAAGTAAARQPRTGRRHPGPGHLRGSREAAGEKARAGSALRAPAANRPQQCPPPPPDDGRRLKAGPPKGRDAAASPPSHTIAFARGPRGAGSRHRLGLDAAVGPPRAPLGRPSPALPRLRFRARLSSSSPVIGPARGSRSRAPRLSRAGLPAARGVGRPVARAEGRAAADAEEKGPSEPALLDNPCPQYGQTRPGAAAPPKRLEAPQRGGAREQAASRLDLTGGGARQRPLGRLPGPAATTGLPRKCRQAPKSRRSRVDLVALRRDAAGARAACGGRGGRIGRLRNRVDLMLASPGTG